MATVTTTRTPAELAQVVKRAVATLRTLQAELEVDAPNLTATMKRHTARYRRGGDKVISTIVLIARQQGFEVPSLPVSEMSEQLAIATALGPLGSELAMLQAYLGNIVFSARADAWQTAMQYYALLRRMAKGNAALAKTLEPVTKFMSVHDPRPKPKRGEPTRAAQRKAKKAVKVLERNPATAALLAPKPKK